jgi:hypothetical protein
VTLHTASWQATPGSASPASSTGDPSTFNPVGNQGDSVDGSTLLVVAYAVVWLALMLFVVAAWRRTRSLEEKVVSLEKAVERASVAATTPSTKRSGNPEKDEA